MGKVTLNIPDSVLDELRTAADKNVRTLTDEIVWRCMALDHTSMALDHTRLVQLVIKTGLEAIEHMVPDHTSMAPNHISMAPDHIPSPADDAPRMAPDHTSMAPDHTRVIEAWAKTFPKEKPLDDVTSKRWLSYPNCSYEDVLDAFHRGQNGGSDGAKLRNYIEKICKDEKGFRAQNKAKAAETVADKPGSTSGWVIRPPTQEELDDDAEAKRILIERGVWNPDAY